MSYFKKREGKKHHAGKIRLATIFQSQLGYDAFFEVPSIEEVEFYVEGPITYYFDVLLGIKGYRNYEYRGFIIAEVDGRVGHRTLRTDSKAYRRDNHFLSKYGIPTARFSTEDLVGSKSIKDSEIIEEMEYQTEGLMDSYKPYYCFVCSTFSQDKEYCKVCRGAQKFKVSMSPPMMAGPSMIKNIGKGNYLRKTLPLSLGKKYHTCTHCNHGFHKHTFAGCSCCKLCITGIIHSSDKKDS